jgi:hypothetical protein
MSTYIPADLRRLVRDRADLVCEYCLIAEEDTHYGLEVDHIISEKHGGQTDEANLACACLFCNQAKGSDIGSIEWITGDYHRFFNPRQELWRDHFLLVEFRIEKLTPIGEVTSRLLRFNARERLEERRLLRAKNRYPSKEARKRM